MRRGAWFRRFAGGILLGVAALCVLLSSASAYTRLDPPSPDYVIGDLTWQSGKGGVSWKRGASSDEHFKLDPKHDEPGGQYTQNTVPYYQNVYLPYFGVGTYSEGRPIEFTSPALAADLHINASRLVQIRLIVRPQTGYVYEGACSDGLYQMGVRLFLGDKFIGGARGTSPYYDYTYDGSGQVYPYNYPSPPDVPSGHCLLTYGIQSEEPVWPGGSVLKIEFLLRTQSQSTEWKMTGSPRTHIAIPVFSDIELAFRTESSTDVQAQDSGSASDTDDVPLAWALVGLPLVAIRRFGRRQLLVLLVVFSLLGAGCMGSRAASQDSDQNGIQRGDVDQTLVPGGDGPNGTIFGVIIDEFRRPVAQAHISVLGESAFGQSDGQGRFQITDLKPGKYTLRVDRAGFRAFETKNPIEVKPGQKTYIEFVLLLLVRGEGGAAPHDHDYWVGSSQLLMEAQEIGKLTSTRRLEFGIPPPDAGQEYNSVLPGTYLMKVTLEWSSSTVPLMGLDFRDPHERNPVNYTSMYPRASGVPFQIPIDWEMQDPGHQRYSTWWFSAKSHQHTYGGTLQDGAVPVPVKATIEIFRGGRVPIDAPHIDHWGSNTTMFIADQTVVQPYCSSIYFTCSSKPGQQDAMSAMNVSWSPTFVPMGTEWIDVVATAGQVSNTEPPTYRVYYKGAWDPPNGCAVNRPSSEVRLKEATLVEGSPTSKVWKWRIDVGADDADPFYARATSWCVWLARESGTYASYFADHVQNCPMPCTQTYSQFQMKINMTAHGKSPAL